MGTDYELTGLEEHEHFMAGAEDMELRAMRLEVERDMEAFYAGEAEVQEEEWQAKQADPLRAVCCYLGGPGCQEFDDDLPF